MGLALVVVSGFVIEWLDFDSVESRAYAICGAGFLVACSVGLVGRNSAADERRIRDYKERGDIPPRSRMGGGWRAGL